MWNAMIHGQGQFRTKSCSLHDTTLDKQISPEVQHGQLCA